MTGEAHHVEAHGFHVDVEHPAVWEASTTSSRPCSLAKRPMARISSRFPVRLEPWVQMMPRVLGRSRRRKSS